MLIHKLWVLFYGDFDSGGFADNFMRVANAVENAPKQLATHLALTALSSFATKQQPNAPLTPTMEALTSEALSLLSPGTELPEDFEASVGEVYVSSLLPPPFHIIPQC